MTQSYYRWKLTETPLRVGVATAWLAESDGRIVGQYAGTPMRFQHEGEIVQALHGCDVMTAPDFRGRGVLTALGTVARDAWADSGITLVTGLHYGGWGSRRHFLGWREQFRALHLWRPIRLDRIVRRILPLPPLGSRLAAAIGAAWMWMTTRSPEPATADITVVTVSRPGPQFDTLWRRIGRDYESLVVRDRVWVTYRYADAPDGHYRIMLATRGEDPMGYIVIRVPEDRGRVGLIVDLFASAGDEVTRSKLVRAALAALDEAGAHSVRTYVSEGTSLFRELRRLGFLRWKGHFDVSIIPLERARDYASLSDPSRWFVMPGDFDVY